MSIQPNPLADQWPDSRSTVAGPPVSSAPRRPRIAIADDDFDVRDTLARMFERDGFEVLVASDGDALVRLLERARRTAGDPDVLLLDHRMPSYTGLEVLDGLRAWGFHKPAVLITAFGEVAGDARALGAMVLEKPFEPDVLRRLVFDQVGLSARLVDASDAADQVVVEVVCVSCGHRQRLIDDDARDNPPTWFCDECRERARPSKDDVIGVVD